MEVSDEQLLKENSGIVVNNDTMSFKEQEWKTEHEKILVEWADKAMCYRWLHGRSHQAYSKTNAWFTIPVIIMSTLTGTANFAQDRFPEDVKPLAQMSIGAVNIFAGILTTIAQFLKIGELNEAHRVSAISWDKFYRNIKVELAKSRDERMHVGHMLKICKEEYDRLMETSPSINDKIIRLFNNKFPVKKIEPKEEEAEINRPDIMRPEICDELVSTAEILFVTPIVSDTNLGQPSIMEIVRKKNQILAGYEKEVRDWSDKFEEKHNRKPLEEEMLDNLQDKMNPGVLAKIVRKMINDFENNSDEEDPINKV
jgi:uncharacterized protein YeeX (DUF496 family)